MTDADQELGLLAKAVIVVAIVLFVMGFFWHGVSLKVVEQFWHDLIERPDGPMRFRFVQQPLMATIVAIRDGLKDARSGRSAYLATVLGNPQERVGRLREGLNATARIIALGLVIDLSGRRIQDVLSGPGARRGVGARVCTLFDHSGCDCAHLA